MASPVASTKANSAGLDAVRPPYSAAILAGFAAVVLALLWANLGLAHVGWAHLFAPGDKLSLDEMLFRYSFLPRLAVSALAGAGLGIASFIFQRLLSNPLADPSSLGIAAGASLAMSVVSLWVPALQLLGQEWIALGGGLLAFVLIVLIAGPRLPPLRLISAGLIISLLCGSINAVLTLFNGDFLQSVFIWGSGSLNQNSWDVAAYLFPRVMVTAGIALVFQRPLFVLSLGDESARSLGVPIAAFRMIALLIAVGLSCSIVSAVGIIGFVGMAAPVTARLIGFRRPSGQIMASALLGAMMLIAADQAAQLIASAGRDIPTGAMTAVIGAPLLLALLPRLKSPPAGLATEVAQGHSQRIGSPSLKLLAMLIAVAAIAFAAFFVARSALGWHWASLTELERYLPWRWPRIVASLCAGAMLGCAGAALQRLTRNPMASPEVLGISSGASLGVIVLIFMSAGDMAQWTTFLAACAGAAAAMSTMLIMGRRFGFSPERTLLLGIAFGTAFTALSTILMSSGDPRFRFLLAWMAGSTYDITAAQALSAAFAAVILVPLTMLTYRWLGILGLGDTMAQATGVTIASARGAILLLTSGLTATSILLIGPLSFVGLIGPHLATAIGLRRPLHHLAGSVMIGAAVMVVADWLGRNLLFPYQVPAGLLAALVGGPYFLVLHARQRS